MANSLGQPSNRETSRSSATPRPGGETGDQPIVFVIDDDDSVRRSLERLLRSVNLDVQTFSTAREPPSRGSALIDMGQLRRRVEEEIERAADSARPFGLAVVSAFRTPK
mgnify:CR=1 FL=1